MTDSTHKRGMAGIFTTVKDGIQCASRQTRNYDRDEILRTRLSQVHAGDGRESSGKSSGGTMTAG